MRRTWPLTGRREELAAVEAAMAGGEMSGVVLAGLAGVGKSRLAAEILERARERGHDPAWAVATESARRIPFGALAHLLPARIPGAEAPQNLLRAAGDALLAREPAGRLVLGVDDAHLLDDSSAALLHHVALARGAFVVATVRTGEPAPDPVAALWKGGLANRVEVQALSESASRELLEAALGGAVDASTEKRLWAATLGNPLFLREVVLGGMEAGTLVRSGGTWRWRGGFETLTRLPAVVEERLGQLSAGERRALEVAAVGDPVGEGVLAAIEPGAPLEALQRRGLLVEVRSGRRRALRPAHPLYSEGLRAGAPPARVRAISRQLAEALEATGARRREDLLRVATLRLAAGESGSPAMLVAAARQAMAAFDFPLAERLARAAVDGGGGFAATHALADALVGEARFEAADELLTALVQMSGSEPERGLATVARALNLFFHLGRGSEAEAVLADLEAEVAHDGLRDELAAVRGQCMLFRGASAGANELELGVLERANTSPLGTLQAAMTAAWGLNIAGRGREARAVIDRHADLARSSAEELPLAVDLLVGNRQWSHYVSGSIDEAVDGGHRLYDEALGRGALSARGIQAFVLGWMTRSQGRPATSAAWCREAVGVFREVDQIHNLPAALGDLAHAQALLGETEAAARTLEEADAERMEGFAMEDAFIELGRVWTLAAGGELSSAIAAALECAGVAAERGQRLFEAVALHDAARLGERSAVAALSEVAAGIDPGLVSAFAAHAAALERGDGGALVEASATFERMGALLLAAEAAAEAAQAFRDGGRRSSAFAAAGRAGALAARCEGARTPALALAGERLPLTRRELEAAMLAARGLSNREIAERLVVSVRTVDNHLHSAYRKLGIQGRAELDPILNARV